MSAQSPFSESTPSGSPSVRFTKLKSMTWTDFTQQHVQTVTSKDFLYCSQTVVIRTCGAVLKIHLPSSTERYEVADALVRAIHARIQRASDEDCAAGLVILLGFSFSPHSARSSSLVIPQQALFWNEGTAWQIDATLPDDAQFYQELHSLGGVPEWVIPPHPVSGAQRNADLPGTLWRVRGTGCVARANKDKVTMNNTETQCSQAWVRACDVAHVSDQADGQFFEWPKSICFREGDFGKEAYLAGVRSAISKIKGDSDLVKVVLARDMLADLPNGFEPETDVIDLSRPISKLLDTQDNLSRDSVFVFDGLFGASPEMLLKTDSNYTFETHILAGTVSYINTESGETELLPAADTAVFGGADSGTKSGWDGPKTGLPKTGLPKTGLPKTGLPKTGLHGTEFVETGVSEIHADVGVYKRAQVKQCLSGNSASGALSTRVTLNRALRNDKLRLEHTAALDPTLERLVGVTQGELHIDSCRLKQCRGIAHIETVISGRLKRETSPLRALSLIHPTGAIAGEPRARALEIIAELEPFDRELYGGAVGFIAEGNICEFTLAIRCAQLQTGRIQAFAGCGIVKSSDPEKELEETELKFKRIIDATNHL